MNGQRRYWHVGHVLMATGMAYMYLPHSTHVIPSVAGASVFAGAAAASIGAAASLRLRDGALNPLWILIIIETAVMVYMFLPMNARSVLVSSVMAVYLAGVGTLWALGRWDRHYVSAQRRPSVVHASTPGGPTAPALRLSLATMAAAMAYMLVAM